MGVLSSNTFYNAHHSEERGPTFSTGHYRQEYIESNFELLKFHEKPLSLDIDGGPTIFYFPVEDTLNSLLKDESIQDMLEDSFVKMKSPHTGEVFEDYGDGKVHKTCRCQEDHIELLFFQDAFCCAKNNIGSAAQKLKFNGTYFSIGNLPPHIRSQEASMYLSFLIEDAICKKLGPQKVFKSLVTELKKLQSQGVKFKDRILPVKVSFIIGDNLGSNQVGGFTECFSSKYFCRFCEVTRTQFHSNVLALRHLRSKEEYIVDLEKLAELKERKPNVVTYKGLKSDSIFNKLEDFHVTDPRLPPCLGHDLFEGVVSWDLKAMLLYFVSKSWFTLAQLSSLIKNFKYGGRDIKNKPAKVKEGKITLGGHAVQNWTLLRLLPFILEKRIKDPEDQVWQLYLMLKNVVEYACAPKFDRDNVSEFSSLIKKYLKKKQEKLPDSPLKPKHHFLLHYSMLILHCGPLIYLWAMRWVIFVVY